MAPTQEKNGTNPATGRERAAPERGERGVGSYISSDPSQFTLRTPGRPTVGQLRIMRDNDPWVESVFGAITSPIRSAGFYIEEAAGDTGEAEACREVFLEPEASGGMRTPIETVIAQMTGAVLDRTSFHEVVWGFRDGMHVVEALAYRDASTCHVETDDNGNFAGFRQRAYSRKRGFVNEPFRKSKSLVYVHDGSANPLVGRSAFETAYRNYDDKRKLMFLYWKALEKFGAPPTVGKTESQSGEDQVAMFEKAENVRSNGAVGLGPGESIDFPEVPEVGAQLKDALRYLDFLTAVSNHVQFLALAQEGNSGAYALSKDHHDMLNIITMARMGEIASAITTQPMAHFVRFNFGPDAAYPTFKFQSLVEEDKQRALDVLMQLLTKAGVPLDPLVMQAIVEKGLQALGIDFEKLEDDDGGRSSDTPSVARSGRGYSTVPPVAADPVIQRATEALGKAVGQQGAS